GLGPQGLCFVLDAPRFALVGATVNDHVSAAGGAFENDGAADVAPRTRHEDGLASKVEIRIDRHAEPSLLCRRPVSPQALSHTTASRHLAHCTILCRAATLA